MRRIHEVEGSFFEPHEERAGNKLATYRYAASRLLPLTAVAIHGRALTLFKSQQTRLSWTSACFFLLLAFCTAVPLGARAEWSFLDSWRSHPPFQGSVPKRSDVVFSTRFKRDHAPDVARLFGATRIEWVNSTDPAFITTLREVAPWFGGTVNSTMPLINDQGIAQDIEGKPIVAPWMKSWGAKWITVADQRTRAALMKRVADYLMAGADSIQVDDPLLQFAARWWGADFSESSLRGFRTFLLSHPDGELLQAVGLDNPDLDYRQFLASAYGIRTAEEYAQRQKQLPTTPIWHTYLKSSVLGYYATLREAIDSVAGRRVALSMNLSLIGTDDRNPRLSLAPFLDYAIVETNIDDYDMLTLQAATYRALGIGFVPSIRPKTRLENRGAIAFLYALGAQPLVPWDVYINNGPESPPTRFFGTADDYSDIYRFVRKNAELFDEFESLPVVGIISPTRNYQQKRTLELVRRLNKANVPFALIPVGETHPLDPIRLRGFRALLTVNSPSDIGAAHLLAIEESGVRMISSEQLNSAQLKRLSPLRTSNWSSTRMVFRGKTSGRTALAIHLIPDAHTSDLTTGERCERALSIDKQFLDHKPVLNVSVYSPLHRAISPINTDPETVTFTVPFCDSWAIALLTLSE